MLKNLFVLFCFSSGFCGGWLLCFVLLFEDRVFFLCGPGYPRTSSVDQGNVELKRSASSLPPKCQGQRQAPESDAGILEEMHA